MAIYLSECVRYRIIRQQVTKEVKSLFLMFPKLIMTIFLFFLSRSLARSLIAEDEAFKELTNYICHTFFKQTAQQFNP